MINRNKNTAPASFTSPKQNDGGSKRSSGRFTLIEVMVAISIMVSLIALTLTYSRRGGDQVILFKERSRLMQEVARARSLSASLFKEEDEKVCGYGITIEDQKTLILFKDLSITNEQCVGNDKLLGPSEDDEEVDRFVLDRQVEFLPEDVGTTVFFLPPKPEIFFDGLPAGAGNSDRQISVTLVENPDTLSVSVNQLGQISTE